MHFYRLRKNVFVFFSIAGLLPNSTFLAGPCLPTTSLGAIVHQGAHKTGRRFCWRRASTSAASLGHFRLFVEQMQFSTWGQACPRFLGAFGKRWRYMGLFHSRVSGSSWRQSLASGVLWGRSGHGHSEQSDEQNTWVHSQLPPVPPTVYAAEQIPSVQYRNRQGSII